ncbi:MAG: nucleoside deaminase [Rhodovarius sp.]|nr:nucleoside deaminase [Rhodovarius sp.]
MSDATAEDLAFLRRAIALAAMARARGDRPFGAVVAEGGEVLAEGESRQGASGGGPLAHSEMVALERLRQAGIGRERLRRATIYSSGEPCAMCAAAIFYMGIGRVVYGLPAEAIAAARNAAAHTAGIGLSCRAVLQAAAAPVTVIGPLLEQEAARPHEGYWGPDAA